MQSYRHIGQWASTRTDMFPASLCASLSGLHADAPAHSWKFTKRSVESALCLKKGSLPQVFESFDKVPIASGSIAQIHKATLRCSGHTNEKNGTAVALKVRHPNVSSLIDMDFRIMTIFANILDSIPALSWLRVRSSVEQFSHTMAAQTHLDVEAHHLEVLNHNFRHWKHVSFPMPLFACSNVIIETFQKGQICTTVIDDFNESTDDATIAENTSQNGLMPVELSKFIVTTGLALYLKMLLVDNLMHADLHPGNIMLDVERIGRDDASRVFKIKTNSRGLPRLNRSNLSNKSMRTKITLVDAGMVADLSDDEINNFAGLMSSLGAGDGRTAGEAVLRFTSRSDGNDGELTIKEREAFVEDMVTLFQDVCQGYGNNVDVGEVLRGVLLLVRKHRVRIDSNYATLVINALCIESLAKMVCPSYNVLDAAKPLLSCHRKLFRTSQTMKRNDAFEHRRLSIRTSIMKMAAPFLFTIKSNFDVNFFRKLESSRTKTIQCRKKGHRRRWFLKGMIPITIIFAFTRDLSKEPENIDLQSGLVTETQKFLE